MPEQLVNSGTGFIPIPDPTVQTNVAIRTAIIALDDKLTARLDAIDLATAVLAETVNRMPTLLDREIRHLIELKDAQFKTVEAQFQAIAESTRLRSDASNTAVNKSDAALEKQLDGIHALLDSTSKSTDEKIAAISSRLDRNDGASRGISQSAAMVISIIGVLTAIVSVLIAWIASSHGAAPR